MTEPKGMMSPAKVDRCAATAVLRTSWSTASARVAWFASPAARLAPHCGQVAVCWSTLAEQAGQVLCMTTPWVGALPWAPVGTASTIGRQARSVVGPKATLGGRPAGDAKPRCHPPDGARLLPDPQPGLPRPAPTDPAAGVLGWVAAASPWRHRRATSAVRDGGRFRSGPEGKEDDLCESCLRRWPP
jgi:hypothetical protein